MHYNIFTTFDRLTHTLTTKICFLSNFAINNVKVVYITYGCIFCLPFLNYYETIQLLFVKYFYTTNNLLTHFDEE